MPKGKKDGIRVLGIVGSPRKKGNTSVLVDQVLKGAESVDGETTKLMLRDLKIKPCIACDKCRRMGVCTHDDDMEKILKLMKKSDVWVFGTPVYWWGPSAQMKTFIDRWYQAVDRLKMMENKRVILVIPFGDDKERTADHVVGMFRDSLNYLDKEITEVILASNVNGPGAVAEHTDLMDRAFDVGVNAVS
jgi:multimeric flavodoxin WrbA